MPSGTLPFAAASEIASESVAMSLKVHSVAWCYPKSLQLFEIVL
jgi:hypothetical protein